MNSSGHGAGTITGACRYQFPCFTVASPAAAWSVLTSPRQTGAYLYGLAAHSS
jgi:hypothetical protein